jgi:hypothetical protein
MAHGPCKHSFECPSLKTLEPGTSSEGPEARGVFLEVFSVNLTSTAAVRPRVIKLDLMLI